MLLLLLDANGQSFTLGPVSDGLGVGGPFVEVDSADPARLVVRAYDRTGALLVEFDEDMARSWQDSLNEPGTGRTALANDDPDLALVPMRSIMRFFLTDFGSPISRARFAAVVQNRNSETITNDQAQEVTVLSGPGALSVLGDAVIYPEGGVDQSPYSDQRRFDFTNPDLDDSAWDLAGPVKRQDFDSPPYQTAPEGWPDGEAYWIWGVPYESPQPVGISYFRKTFTMDDEATVRIFGTADDGFEVFIDGVLIFSETRAYLWGEVKKADVFLSAGDHTIAIKGTNIPRPANPASNIAAVLLTVITLADGGRQLGEVLVHTDLSWRVLGYPAAPPGFTPGHVLRLLLEEAQARGTLTYLAWDFTDLADSLGNAWPVTPDLVFPVGLDYLSVINQLCESYMDVAMAPGALMLHAYAERGEGKPAALTVADNLAALTHETRA